VAVLIVAAANLEIFLLHHVIVEGDGVLVDSEGLVLHAVGVGVGVGDEQVAVAGIVVLGQGVLQVVGGTGDGVGLALLHVGVGVAVHVDGDVALDLVGGVLQAVVAAQGVQVEHVGDGQPVAGLVQGVLNHGASG